MELILTLTIGYYLLSFDNLVLCVKYNVDIVKNITEVPMDAKFHNPKWYHSTHGDYFLDEKTRTEWCQQGLLRVKDHETHMERIFQFQEGYKAEKLKLYIVAGVNNKDAGKIGFKLLMASKCPTSPPIYIYINDLADKNGDKMEFHVILKDSSPSLNFNNINNYHMKLIDYITEATAEDIETILTKGTIEHTLQDTDELEERERLRICQKGTQTVPEMMIKLQANASTGTNKYYVVGHKIDRNKRNPMDVQYLIQAFDCPTEPKLYISVRDGEEAGPILWTMIRLSETELRPKFDIMGYSFILLRSIKTCEKPKNENQSKAVGNVSVDQFANEDENKQNKLDELVNNLDLNESQPKLKQMTSLELIRGLGDYSKFQKSASIEIAANDDYTEIEADKLTKEERHYICANAIEVIFGLDVEFMEDDSETSQYYTVEEDLTGEIIEGLRAYECPTKYPAPKIYLNIIDRESMENMVVVLFEGKEYFNRLRTDAHIKE